MLGQPNKTTNKILIKANGELYDVTDLIERHPGGNNCIFKKAQSGKDCTEDYLFHSKNARREWDKYRISCNSLASALIDIFKF